jgi:hypothetical protein
MDNPQTEYFKLFHDYAREDLTIGFLEGELRKRKARRTKLREASDKAKAVLEPGLTDAQRADVLQHALDIAKDVADTLIKEYKLKIAIGDCSWALESEEGSELLFDDPHFAIPNVCVISSDAESIVVNIRDSLIKEPKNIGDGVIVAAIHRYVDRLSMPSPADLTRRRDLKAKASSNLEREPRESLTRQQAEERLTSMFDALIEGAKLRARKQAKEMNDLLLLLSLSNENLDDNHFSKLAAILNDDEIRRIERLNLPTNLRNKLKKQLKMVFPDPETCERILAFLVKGKVPKRRTGPTLRNAFFAFERKIDPGSFRKYRSEGVSQFLRKTGGISAELSLSEKDVEKILVAQFDRILLHRGIGKLETYSDLKTSALVWREMQPHEFSSNLCQ